MFASRLRILVVSGLLLCGLGCHVASIRKADEKPISAATALEAYLDNGDQFFSWELRESREVDGLEINELLLTSQQWKGSAWLHHLTILVPEQVSYSQALLFITGGRLEDQKPVPADPEDDLLHALSAVSLVNRIPVVILRQVPNQPLFDNLYEDALIAHTLQQFRYSRDFSWPLLFPMTKSAVRAMDAAEAFCLAEKSIEIEQFILSGASKRGWTTWLAGAVDSRVRAIFPMVIDILNMPVQLDYQVDTWGDYSPEIHDYVDLGIAQDTGTPEGEELTMMIDPFSYRNNLDMPKLIFLGTNDPYWPVDAVKHYLELIPGENYLHHVPNAGHDLNGGKQALETMSAFLHVILQGETLPALNWSTERKENKIQIRIESGPGPLPVRVRLWTAASTDRDFRDEEWISTVLKNNGSEEVTAGISLPVQGFRAFYLDLFYPSTGKGEYTLSTRVFVIDDSGLL